MHRKQKWKKIRLINIEDNFPIIKPSVQTYFTRLCTQSNKVTLKRKKKEKKNLTFIYNAILMKK